MLLFCKHLTHRLVLSLSNFYFPISIFQFQSIHLSPISNFKFQAKRSLRASSNVGNLKSNPCFSSILGIILWPSRTISAAPSMASFSTNPGTRQDGKTSQLPSQGLGQLNISDRIGGTHINSTLRSLPFRQRREWHGRGHGCASTETTVCRCPNDRQAHTEKKGAFWPEHRRRIQLLRLNGQ